MSMYAEWLFERCAIRSRRIPDTNGAVATHRAKSQRRAVDIPGSDSAVIRARDEVSMNANLVGWRERHRPNWPLVGLISRATENACPSVRGTNTYSPVHRAECEFGAIVRHDGRALSVSGTDLDSI
ncbi:unnamed protein product [Rhizoctonia solani]|uniref:Uncharacterized protein n=1 Tax=Rhizoctonia solani TaxID=456999 RepID=A0A8H3CP79_9AGAM|nr:unnamed protein product [Rhizoctonia solani]